MSEEITVGTPVAGEDVLPETAAEITEENNTEVQESAEKSATPKVEHRDNKVYVDGVRLYTRSETNSIAANAQKEAEKRILSDLQVDSIDKVKSVVQQLQSSGVESLDVSALKQEVQKREQTVEELKAELNSLKTDYALKEHISKLKDAMPTSWTPTQKDSVVKLMKADDMFALEENNFYIKNGEEFLTVDGETPDYAGAVTMVGKTLGLPSAKKGVDNFDSTDNVGKTSVSKEVDQNRLSSDNRYRSAYVSLRKRIGGQPITHDMVVNHMDKMVIGSLNQRSLGTS